MSTPPVQDPRRPEDKRLCACPPRVREWSRLDARQRLRVQGGFSMRFPTTTRQFVHRLFAIERLGTSAAACRVLGGVCHRHHVKSRRLQSSLLFSVAIPHSPAAMDRTLPQPQVPRPPRWIPQFLLSPGLRLFCFRIVIISAALLAILSIVEIPHYSTFRREDVLILVLVFATAVHHIGTYVALPPASPFR